MKTTFIVKKVFISLEHHQIKDMFENEGPQKHLINHDRQPVISDIVDGELYKMHSDFVDGYACNSTFTWNTDGVPVFKSSKFNIWPLFSL